MLLFGGYRRTKLKLLLWSGIGFFLLTLSNIGVYLDFVIYTQDDLSLYRVGITFVAMLIILFGMIWETVG